MQDFIIGTAGHIDHGKTTLLKTLTGIDTDRLQEEKLRGITIDLGFAHMELDPYRLGFIDVPGHARFVKNMLAGVGGIQLVLLIVAADESVMPQTIEHFQICKLLEIPRGIVVITKKDLVEPELLSLVEKEVQELVQGSFLEKAPVITVDSLSGAGLSELREILWQELRRAEREIPVVSPLNQIFRLPIDRVFSMHGFGTVVTGTPHAGQLRKGELISVYPSGKIGKVRRIEIFNRKAQLAGAGQRTALNLTGFEKEDLKRGMVLCPSDTVKLSHMFDALVRLVPNAPQPLKQRSPIRFHYGSAELIGRVYLLEGKHLHPGQSALVQLRLNSPAACFPKDHFILRRYSPMTTIGGGVILDNAPQKHQKKDLPQLLSELKTLQSNWEAGRPTIDHALLEYFIKCKGYSGMLLSELVSRTGYTKAHLLDILKSLNTVVLVPQEPFRVVFKATLRDLKKRLVNFLSSFHSSNPLATGFPREELKSRFFDSTANSYFQFTLDLLGKERQIRASASTVSLYGKRVELSESQLKIREQIFQVLKERWPQSPTLNEVLAELPDHENKIQEVYYFLLQAGELVRVSQHIVLSSSQIDFLKQELKKSFPSGAIFSVSEFKDLFQISRKYAIPLLEFLDRERVTRRIKDKRLAL